MNTSRKFPKKSKNLFFQILILALFLTFGLLRVFALEEKPNQNGAMLLVLEDCDNDDNDSTPPFGDMLSLINSKSEPVKKFRGLRIKSAFNGPRFISVSEDGRFFVVCENVPGNLIMYETATFSQLWTLWMNIRSAVFANDLIYAVNNHNVFAIDNTGTIVKHARLGGLDIAVDPKHNCLWIVGNDIKKCNLDLELQLKTELTLYDVNTDALSVDISSDGSIWIAKQNINQEYGRPTLYDAKMGALSVDISPDGSIWIAEQNINQEYGSKNRLVKRSLNGEVLKIIDLDFSPIRLRINSFDGSLWTTGMTKEKDFSKIGDEWPETLDELNKLIGTNVETFTRKYDSEGNLLFEISEGGYSIELDQSDSSVWLADKTNIWHYSGNGRNLGSYAGSSDAQKWLAIVPASNK